MAEITRTPSRTETPSASDSNLQTARELFLAGSAESDRQATEILLQVLSPYKSNSGSVPLDRVESLAQLVHLLASQGSHREAGEWASLLYSSIEGREEWLKKGTLHDSFVWASKALALAGRAEEARAVETRFLRCVAPRVDRPGCAVVQSLFRTAVYHHQEGNSMRALIAASRASDIGWNNLRGSKEDAMMLLELLFFVKALQEQEGAAKPEIARTRNRISETRSFIARS